VKTLFYLSTLLALAISCVKQKSTTTLTCTPVEVSDADYAKADVKVRIDSVELKDNCLVLYLNQKISQPNLVVQERFRKTLPPRLSAALSIPDANGKQQLSVYSFDLKPIQRFSNAGVLFLNVKGYSEAIRYTYVD
jgi:hypothetical protein